MATSALTLLKTDHREVEDLFGRYGNAADPQQKRLVVEQIIRELSIHAAIEEQLLYPVVVSELPDGERLAEEARREHQEVKETLAELDRTDPSEPGYDQRVRSLIQDVSHHVREEEQEMFPKFERAIGRDRLLSMGQAMEIAKRVAPTHPHPNVPAEPPFGLVTGPVAGAVDRTRDAARTAVRRVTGRPTKPTVRKRATAKKKPAAKRTSSKARPAAKRTTSRAKATAKRATRTAKPAAKRATSRAKATAKRTTTKAKSTAKRTTTKAKATAKRTTSRAKATVKRTTSRTKAAAKRTTSRAKPAAKRTTSRTKAAAKRTTTRRRAA